MTEKRDDTIILGRKSRALLPTDHKITGKAIGQQWQTLMKKFSDSHKEQCKSKSMELPRLSRSAKEFPTGSEYEGQWNVFGMSGFGTYTFPYEGIKYVGQFEDGMFHGPGELRYESGSIVRGTWHKGQIVDRHLFFGDGLEYEDYDWKYCRMPDRRFTIEYLDEVKPAFNSYMTAVQPPIEIPPGHYDVGDGFYDPETKMVYKYDDDVGIVRSPNMQEHHWIVANCRKSPDEPIGPYKFVYETWTQPTLKLEVPPPPAARMADLDREAEVPDGLKGDTFGRGTDEDTLRKEASRSWGDKPGFSYNPSVTSIGSLRGTQGYSKDSILMSADAPAAFKPVAIPKRLAPTSLYEERLGVASSAKLPGPETSDLRSGPKSKVLTIKASSVVDAEADAISVSSMKSTQSVTQSIRSGPKSKVLTIKTSSAEDADADAISVSSIKSTKSHEGGGVLKHSGTRDILKPSKAQFNAGVSTVVFKD